MQKSKQESEEVVFLEMAQDDFQRFESLPIDEPIQMINLLKFRNRTIDGTLGSERYDLYLKTAKPFFAEVEMKILYFGSVQQSLIGPEKEWDKILIVEYASKEDFLKAVTQKGYPSELRLSALEDSRLLCCTIKS